MIDVSRAHGHAMFDLLAPLTDDGGVQRFFGQVDVPDAKLKRRYLIVWASPGVRDLLTMAGNLSDLTTTTQITAVGRNVDEVLALLDRAADLLQGVRPVISGRVPGFIRQVPTDTPVRPNETLRTAEGAPTYRGIALFTLNSTAAPVTTL
jgi:hypothetical protein